MLSLRHMKILVVAPTPFFADRGTHIRILEEALALEKKGHQITIATYHIGRDLDGDLETKIDVRRIRRLLFWYKKLEAGPDWQKLVLDLMLIRKAFYLARTQRPDVIHGHLHEGVLIGWIVQKLLFWRRMKLVADFHGSLTREMESHSYLKGGALKRVFRAVEAWIDNLGDFALTSSWENTAEIKELRADGKVETVLDGVNMDHYREYGQKEFFQRELELPPSKKIVTYTGALLANKGLGYFLEAIPAVLARNKEIFFVIAGFPVEGVEEFVRANKLEESVRIVHPLNYFDLPRILLASDLGIDPKDSGTRQASGKILQYMAAGLPVVCFDRTNNREYLGEAGQYAAEVSARGLATAILALLSDEATLRAKSLVSRERARLFSWDGSAEKIEETYRSLR